MLELLYQIRVPSSSIFKPAHHGSLVYSRVCVGCVTQAIRSLCALCDTVQTETLYSM